MIPGSPDYKKMDPVMADVGRTITRRQHLLIYGENPLYFFFRLISLITEDRKEIIFHLCLFLEAIVRGG